MPYLPPPPEELQPELACTLVFYPQADEYRAALLGQLAELSDVWNWEADRATQAIIRQVWLDAEHATLECWNMACLDEILALLTEIRDRECCADISDLLDPIPVDGGGQVWIIGVGGEPVPIPDNDTSEGAGEYPITPATDPDGGGTVSHTDWTSYLCGASNWVIDSLIDWLYLTRTAINLSWDAVSIISWIGARIAARFLPGELDDIQVWSMPTVAETLGDVIPNLQSEQIDLAIENLDNARDALACAFVGQDTATNAINALLALLSSYVADAAVLALLTSPIALLASLIWNGAIDTDWDTGCDCPPGPELHGTAYRFRMHTQTGTNNSFGVDSICSQNHQQTVYITGDALPSRGMAGVQAALDVYTDTREVLDLHYPRGTAPEATVRFRNTSGSTRSGGISVDVEEVYVDGIWLTVSAIEYVSHTGIGTPTVSGRTIVFPTNSYAVGQNTQIVVNVYGT